jgi:alkanesulfonate monooxygenase SsuD/methylene tetrahydromethanopterin reductase-like flavin-dependent oxidoreductase (luciferase family)
MLRQQSRANTAWRSCRRFLLGLGVSHVPLVEEARGHQYRQPVSTMRAYLDSMDKALSIAPPLDEPPPTVLAALGPRMTALAGERTAGAFPYNVTSEHTARARAILGPEKWLCVEQKVLLLTDQAKAREVARRAMAFLLALDELSHQLAAPRFRRSGFGKRGQQPVPRRYGGLGRRSGDPTTHSGPFRRRGEPCLHSGTAPGRAIAAGPRRADGARLLAEFGAKTKGKIDGVGPGVVTRIRQSRENGCRHYRAWRQAPK